MLHHDAPLHCYDNKEEKHDQVLPPPADMSSPHVPFHAITCNEVPLRMRHRAVRKNTHAGLQRLPSAPLSSCRTTRATTFSGGRILGLNDFRTKQILGLQALGVKTS